MTQHTTRTSRRKARKRAAALNDGSVTTKVVCGVGTPRVLDEAAVIALSSPSDKRTVGVELKSLGRTIYVSSPARARSLLASDEAIIATSG